jgi:predicted ATPase
MEKLFIQIAKYILEKMSPQMREAACRLVLELEAKAQETANPWDDMLVKIARVVLGC